MTIGTYRWQSLDYFDWWEMRTYVMWIKNSLNTMCYELCVFGCVRRNDIVFILTKEISNYVK